MNIVDLKELKTLTQAAIEKGAAEFRAAEERKVLAQLAEKRVETERAERHILVIPGAARVEASLGKNQCIVMQMGYADYKRPTAGETNYGKCDPQWLVGAAAIVYKQCAESGLKPTVEHWHDGVGINDGFNIVIHW